MTSNVSIFIFMAADNNLYIESIKDIRELSLSSSSDNVNVVVEVDRRSAFSFEDETQINELHSKRLLIKGNEIIEIEDLGETNTGDPNTLREFILWGVNKYPADHYILILWNHGGGVSDEDVYDRFNSRMIRPFFSQEKEDYQIRWVLSDDKSRDFLDMAELKTAIDTGVNMDVLGFDACLMSMFEVHYQIRSSCHTVIGSQEVEPPEGWPYTSVVNYVTENDNFSGNEFSLNTVDQYQQYYLSKNKRTTQSAFRIDGIEEIGAEIDKLAKEILDNYDSCELPLSRVLRKVQKFTKRDYIDLLHFSNLCKEHINMASIISICSQISLLTNRLIINNKVTGSGLEDANGISILFPSVNMTDEEHYHYKRLDFVLNHPNWYELIKRYHMI